MAAAGLTVPALESKPSLTGYEWLYEAFVRLTTCRQIGMSQGPIPWTAIDQYATAEGLDEDERFMLFAVVRHMDTLFLDYSHQKQKQQQKQKPQ